MNYVYISLITHNKYKMLCMLLVLACYYTYLINMYLLHHVVKNLLKISIFMEWVYLDKYAICT